MTATTVPPLPLSKLSTGEKSYTCHCLPLRPPQAALFLAIFQSALFTLGQDWHRTRVSPNAYQEGRARQLCLLLPALAQHASFRPLPCPDQGPFDLLQTIGNIIHQRLLCPLSLFLSLSLSFSPFLSLSTTSSAPVSFLYCYIRFAGCFAQISMQSVELSLCCLPSQSFNHVSFASLLSFQFESQKLNKLL